MMLGVLTFSAMALAQAQGPGASQPEPANGSWTISPQRSVKWSGVEHTPIGACLPGDPAKIKEAQQAGITDFVIDLPVEGVQWSPVIEALEAGKSRYFIRISSPAPAPKVWVVEPGSYRQLMTDKRAFDISLPGADEALAALVNRRSVDVRWSQRVTAKAERLSFIADAKGLDSVMLIYPLMKSSSLPDFWDGWDQHRDSLLRTVKGAKLGSGFRGMIDPIGSAPAFPSEDLPAVPASEMFRLELEQLLQLRHGTIDKALQAWALRANDIRSFKRLSRMVPLWSGRRGLGGFYDPVLDRIHVADSARSSAWKDIRDAAGETMHRRVNRLVTALQSQFDAPVVQTFTGWDGPWARSSTALNGISLQLGTLSSEESGALSGRAAGALSGWIKPGMMTALVDLSADPALRQPVERTVQNGMPLGISGWFFRPSKQEDLAEIALASRVAERLWAGHGAAVRILPFPDAARGAAQPQALSSSVWWAPGPGTGERLSLESGVEGYRYQWGSEKFIALWSDEPKKLRFRASQPKLLAFESLDGSAPDVRLRGKTEVEIALGRLPILIRDPEEVPAPMDSFAQVSGRVQNLILAYDSQVNVGGQSSNVLSECLRGFDTQPGGSLVKLLDLLRVVGLKVAPYAWTEAEQVTEQTFTDIDEVPGASRGRVLSAVSRLAPLPAALAYGIRIRQAGLHEVWVSGKISRATMGSLTFTVGGTTISPDGRLMQYYGKDLAWYRVGSIDLQTGIAQIKMALTAFPGDPVLVDSILLTPIQFKPNGPIPPMDWVSSVKAPKTGLDALPSGSPKPAASQSR